MRSFEHLLTERYGEPVVTSQARFLEYRWKTDVTSRQSVLYKPLFWTDAMRRQYGALEQVYCDVVGGLLLGGSIKLATLRGPELYGLYPIEEFWRQPEVQAALQHDPSLCFFMDSANVWFYGVKGDQLHLYDSETYELEQLGPVVPALESLLAQWEEAKR